MEALRTIIEYSYNYVTTVPGWALALQALLVWVVYLAIKGIFFILVLRLSGRHRESVSYNRGGNKNILLLGDSTAVGTGAKDPSKTIAAFLARDFPNTNIINKAINGSLTSSVAAQLKAAESSTYNMIIISTGGNDVWNVTRSKKLKRDIQGILKQANFMSNNRAVLLFFGNEGSAPFFPMFLTGLLMRRTEMVRSVFAQVAAEEKVPFIELFSNSKKNPFVIEPNKYFAPDGLHPNDAGYWEWYKHLWRLMVGSNYFFHENQ